MVGGLSGLPILTGIGCIDPKWGFALVRHGALIEMGWELGDFARLFNIRTFEDDGDIQVTGKALFFTCCHHAMSCLMAIPMNLYYGESMIYPEALLVL